MMTVSVVGSRTGSKFIYPLCAYIDIHQYSSRVPVFLGLGLGLVCLVREHHVIGGASGGGEEEEN